MAKVAHILIVDDDPLNRVVLENTLSDEYSISLCASGEEAVSFLESNTVDLIISDIAPNTSGNQFLDQTNSYNLSLLSVNFINEFLCKGGNFLVKNFQGEDTEKLFKHIKSLFNKCSYVKPEASDKSSKEIYILGLEKK